uniref:Uncharacterized protein n=1 Tax=Rhizophora mucronata TaxID=61149 RepID=A0A2P2NE30_RHIMU
MLGKDMQLLSIFNNTLTTNFATCLAIHTQT